MQLYIIGWLWFLKLGSQDNSDRLKARHFIIINFFRWIGFKNNTQRYIAIHTHITLICGPNKDLFNHYCNLRKLQATWKWLPTPEQNVGLHYCDVIMGTTTSQIISLVIVYSTVYSGADQRKHQSSASLAFAWGSHRWPVNSPHKRPVTRKMFPFEDVIISFQLYMEATGYSTSNTTPTLVRTTCVTRTPTGVVLILQF